MKRFVAVAFLVLSATAAPGQVCSTQTVLRSATCPAGTDCATKSGRLTHAELDGSLANSAQLCTALDAHLADPHLPAGITWSAASDCGGANGGALTITGNAVVCSDDDGGGGGGITGSGTAGTYPVFATSTSLGDGRLLENGTDLDINLPSTGGVELHSPDGTQSEFLRISPSGDNAVFNTQHGKATFQVLGSPVLDVLFGGIQALKPATFQQGAVVTGGTFRPPSSDTLPTCDSNVAGAIHFDSTAPGAWCGCTGTAPWVLIAGSGTCN